jgi:hypothetical protein
MRVPYERTGEIDMSRLRWIAVVVSAVAVVMALLPASAASARPAGNSSTACSSLRTICVVAAATDVSVCSDVGAAVQCTPALVATAVPAHGTRPPLTSGRVDWSGLATCEYRKRADGFNNDWTAWTSCGPSMRSGNSSRAWTDGQNPSGGDVVLQWPTIMNYDTWLAMDCVEIRVSIATSANAYSYTAGRLLEMTSTVSRFPSTGLNVDGICEDRSAY